MIAINMLFKGNEEKRLNTIEQFKLIFDVVFSIKSDKEANEVFFLISLKNGQAADIKNYQKSILNAQIHVLQKHFNAQWTKGMNTLEHIDNLKLHKPKEASMPETQAKKKNKKKNKK